MNTNENTAPRPAHVIAARAVAMYSEWLSEGLSQELAEASALANLAAGSELRGEDQAANVATGAAAIQSLRAA